jgi:multicomponent Na+:H+ antiporter subunit E
VQLVGLLLSLLVSWVLWSGIYKPLLLWLGLFSCLLSVWLARRMGFFLHAVSLRTLLRLPVYWCWLLREVIKSSLDVARLVLSPSLPISPTMVELTTTEVSDVGKVILGNSITLSPGTVTIDVHEDRLLVHCLTREYALALLEQEVQRRTSRLGIG